MKVACQVFAFAVSILMAFGSCLQAQVVDQNHVPGTTPPAAGTVGGETRSTPDASSAKGAVPELEISPAQLSFPRQEISTSSPFQAITLTNHSQKEIKVITLAVSSDFVTEPKVFAELIKPAASVKVFVSFKPKQKGAVAGIITILSSASETTQTVYLSGNTPEPGLCSASLRTEVSLVAALGLLYWLAMVMVRWNRIARPSRELLRAEITALESGLETAIAKNPGEGANVESLLKAAKGLIDRTTEASGYRIADFLFWSRGQELTGWGYIHEAEIQMARLLPDSTVTARLESAEQRLRLANDAPSLALANSIHQATGNPQADLDRRRALLAEALSANYQREDNSYADMVSWQNKASWLVGCGLVLILALTGVIPHHSILFLIGGVGGLLSRLSRSLDRKDVPTDYGASWTTLFLSPVAGALGAWTGILLAGLAVKLNILGSAFAGDWMDPCDPATLAIALVFGFSERLLDGVLDKVVGKSGGVDQASTPNPQPPPKPGDGTPGVSSKSGEGDQAAAEGKLAITTDQKLADGKVGVPYSAKLATKGGAGGLKWTVKPGELPKGLQLGQDGTISGTPTAEGTTTFTVAVTDQKSQETRKFSIAISPAS